MNQLEQAWGIYKDHLRTCPYDAAAVCYQQKQTQHKILGILGYDCIGQSAILRDKLREVSIQADVFMDGHAVTIATLDDGRQFWFDSAWRQSYPIPIHLISRGRNILFPIQCHREYMIRIYHHTSVDRIKRFFYTSLEKDSGYSREASGVCINCNQPESDVTPNNFLFSKYFQTLVLRFLDTENMEWEILYDMFENTIKISYRSPTYQCVSHTINLYQQQNPTSPLLDAICLRLQAQLSRNERRGTITPEALLDYFIEAKTHFLRERSKI